jgi:RNA polymerase sigma-70 factor (ECF subfamily)
MLRYNPDEDGLWVSKLRNDNEAAFKVLFDAYRDDVFAYAFSFLNRKEFAEEIVQEAFLKIWIHRASLDPERSFRSYLFTLTRNLTFNFLRKAANSRKLREKVFSMSLSCAFAESEIEDMEIEKIKNEALSLLPPGRKRIYEMSVFEGRSYHEISVELGISPHTVRNQMSKSLETLREFLKAYGVAPCVFAVLLSI